MSAALRPLFVLLPWLMGCQAEVTVSGRILRTRDTDEGLVGGRIAILDADGAEYDSSPTGEDGVFAVLAPARQDIYAEISGDGLSTSSFTGASGTGKKLEIQDGDVYGVDLDEIDALRAQFAGCPGVDDTGGVAFGEIRIVNLSDPETGENPLVTTAYVTSSVGGVEQSACYLDDDGALYDPEVDTTGNAGFFAVFGLPSGFVTLTVGYTIVEDEDILTYTQVWVPEDNGVVPRFPMWVEFPV